MTPTKYQEDVVRKIKEAGYSRVLLEWGLGTGKTFAGKLVCDMWDDDVRLVVCPKSLVKMWTSFLSSESDLPVTDLTKLKTNQEPEIPLKGWYVINYDLLNRRPWISQFKDTAVILDESSFIKNHKTERARKIINMSKDMKHLVMLSGTPCGGRYEYMWSHAFLLGRRMKYDDFKDAFTNSYKMKLKTGITVQQISKTNPYKNIDILLDDLNSRGRFTLRTEDCVDLPDKTDITIRVDAPPEYRKFLETQEVSLKMNGKRKEKDIEQDVVLKGDSVMAMKQGLRRLASSYNPDKLEAFRDILSSTDERIVVFYEFQDDQSALEKICSEEGRPVAVMNQDRKDLMKDSNAYETSPNSVCLIQWQSGGHGLNLQKSRIGVFFSLPESYEQFCQARGRIHRKGQDLPVLYYTLEAEKTIDTKIAKALEKQKNYGDEEFLKDYIQFNGLPAAKEKTEATPAPKVLAGYSASGIDEQLSLFPELDEKKEEKIVFRKKKTGGMER